MRTFADDLRGTFYRCPKCREGVIAVPEEGNWGEPSDEAPSVRGALSEPHPSSREKKTSGSSVERLFDSSGSRETSGEESTTTGSAESAEALVVESSAEDTPLPRKRMPTDETPRGAFFGTGPDAASSSGTNTTGEEASSEAAPAKDETSDEASGGPASEGGPDFVPPDAAKKPVIGSTVGRRPVKVRRILVECALCGYHVAVPPELFGKTVHCPECRADMMFSESSLEPVKDEIIGRIAMEHNERRALEHPIGGPIPSPDSVLRAHRRNAVIVGVLCVLLVGALIAFAWKIFAAKG